MSRKMLLMSKGWKKQMDPHSRLRLAFSTDYSFGSSELFYNHLLLFIFYARRRIPTHQGQSTRCSHLQPDNSAPRQKVIIKISPCVRRDDDVISDCRNECGFSHSQRLGVLGSKDYGEDPCCRPHLQTF
jgi:hypothetical protein